MKLEALDRQSGVYGTVNQGDTVDVSDQLGEELISLGHFVEATKEAAPATEAEVLARKDSGNALEPIHADGTQREDLNTIGRKLHDPLPEQVVEAQQAIEKPVEKADKDAEKVEDQKATDAAKDADKSVKDAKAASTRQVKTDKEAGAEQTK